MTKQLTQTNVAASIIEARLVAAGEIKATKTEIAHFLGIATGVVSNAFKVVEERGWVLDHSRNGGVTVVSRPPGWIGPIEKQETTNALEAKIDAMQATIDALTEGLNAVRDMWK